MKYIKINIKDIYIILIRVRYERWINNLIRIIIIKIINLSLIINWRIKL